MKNTIDHKVWMMVLPDKDVGGQLHYSLGWNECRADLLVELNSHPAPFPFGLAIEKRDPRTEYDPVVDAWKAGWNDYCDELETRISEFKKGPVDVQAVLEKLSSRMPTKK